VWTAYGSTHTCLRSNAALTPYTTITVDRTNVTVDRTNDEETFYPLDALRRLVDACEEEFADDFTEIEFDDDEPVADPDSAITFGMIRQARRALELLS
jgi:hypothetical protein